MPQQVQESHRDEVDAPDVNVSCDVQRTHSIHRYAVLKGVVLLPVNNDLQQVQRHCTAIRKS